MALVEEGSRERVHEAIRKNGGQPLNFQVARDGLRFHGPVPRTREELIMFTDGAGRIQPIWAFVLSALLSVLAFLVAGYSAAAVAGDHVLRFEVIFRPLLAVLLLVIFSWLLSVGNHVEEHRIAAQGLPLTQGWLRQFVVGCVFGLLLVGLAVLPLADLG